jgi:hypothetical protein
LGSGFPIKTLGNDDLQQPEGWHLNNKPQHFPLEKSPLNSLSYKKAVGGRAKDI